MPLPSPLRALMSKAHGPVYAARQRALLRQIVPALQPGDSVLDVGCGGGSLGAAIERDPACPAGVQVRGLERAPRGGEPIPVTAYDGGTMPFDDDAFDVVIIADVLHHEAEPDALLRECARVASRLVILKDHQRTGLAAQTRISFIDWAANAPYDVPCLFRYNTCDQWREIFQRASLAPERELLSMNLYPPIVNLLFGRRLQYMAFLRPMSEQTSRSDSA